MTMMPRHFASRRAASRPRSMLVALVTVCVVAVSGCGEDAAEPGPDVENAEGDVLVQDYDGAYDTNFFDDLDAYTGVEVMLRGRADDVLSSTAFSIVGEDDPEVDPLLVVDAAGAAQLQPGDSVRVTGTLEPSFDVAAVEQDLDVDLDDAVFEDWADQPYLEASNVEVTPQL